MKAIVSHEPGPPSSLVYQDVPDPTAEPGELLIRIAACAVNYPDWLIIQDKYQLRPRRPFIPGAEVAGTVLEVGPGVEGFKPGDRVMAICDIRGMAERLAVSAERCIAIPPSMPFDDASALPIAYGTAFYALTRCGRLEPSQTLLILGAAGGVGIAAVAIGKALGAEVIAAVSSEAKAELALAAGADRTLVYPVGPFDNDGRRALSAQFKTISDKSPAVVLDPVGGDYSEAALRAIGWGGRLVVVGFAASIPSVPLNLVLLKGAEIVSAPFGALLVQDLAEYRRVMEALLELYRVGKIRPQISARLPLDRAADAIALLGERRATGKIVLVPGQI